MKTKKFTFKTDKPTGRYRSFEKNYHHIKYNKVEVGYIDDIEPYRIRLQAMKTEEELEEKGDDVSNRNWKWIVLARKNNSVKEAKEWLNENKDIIFAKYNLKLN